MRPGIGRSHLGLVCCSLPHFRRAQTWTATRPGRRTPSPDNVAVAKSVGAVDILRMGDDGADVALLVGGTAIVSLPATYTWEEPDVEGDAVTISQDVSDEGERQPLVDGHRPTGRNGDGQADGVSGLSVGDPVVCCS